MIQLYIANKKVDLTEDIKIALTYQSTDLETPTTTRNSFSKTISLVGSDVNNAVFGEIWRLDRYFTPNGTGTIGLNFDARKRVPFVLEKNTDVIEEGYVQLNNIKFQNNIIRYDITLYGGVGDFFFNLMYDKDGNTRTLADLYYGFTKEDGSVYSKDEEKDTNIIQWDKDYINSSWRKLESFNKNDMMPNNWITAIPSYSGLYDDFDSDKVLVNRNSFNSTQYPTLGNMLPNTTEKDGEVYYTSNGYALLQTERDMNEWEARDLRSLYQRPAMKWELLAKAISDPNNNGGYTVEWDDNILNSDYFQKSYVMFDRLNFEDVPNKGIQNIYMTTEPESYTSSVDVQIPFTEFNTSGMTSPHIMLNVNMKFTTNNKIQDGVLSSVFSGKPFPMKDTCILYNGFVIKLKIYANDELYAETKNYLQTSLVGNIGVDSSKLNVFKKLVENDLGVNDLYLLTAKLLKISNTECVFSTPIHFYNDLPSNSTIKVEATVRLVSYTTDLNDNLIGRNMMYLMSDVNGSREMIKYNRVSWELQASKGEDSKPSWLDEDGNLINGYYDGNVSASLQMTSVNKNVLFGNTNTPYDYLIGFTKQLNCRFDIDPPIKKVFIRTLDNFYTNDIVDITKQIDYNQGITLNPTLMDAKWYKYVLPTPKTYTNYLYSKKYNKDYGEYRFDSGYEFNAEIKDLYENLVYSNVAPYLYKNKLFKHIPTETTGTLSTLPAAILPSRYKYILWKLIGSGFEVNIEDTYEKDMEGWLMQHKIYPVEDIHPRICCFDRDNKNVSDIKNAFVFFNYIEDTDIPYTLSDNIDDMLVLNDGNPCWLYTLSETDMNGHKIAVFIESLPIFNRYLYTKDKVITASWDFVRPQATFLPDDFTYPDNTTLYDRFWKSYIEDLYDPNGKSVELYCVLKEHPRKALRRIYYFENTYWVLNKITDYDPDLLTKPTKCEFVKIKSLDAYI